MSRVALVLGPAVGVLIALLAGRVSTALAVLAGAAFGSLVAVIARARERRQLTELARRVNRWVGGTDREPLPPAGDHAWQQLTIALNALGASHERRAGRLEHAREVPARLVDALPEPALLFDQDDRMIHANVPARGFFDLPGDGGWTVAQALGSAPLAAAVTEARGSGRVVTLDLTVADHEISARAAPVGEVTLLLILDRSDRVHADAVRRDFVANASHELKTPVAGIVALADALQVTVDPASERVRPLLERLASESAHLGNLVRDLLDLRRLEDDRATAPRRAVDLVAIVHEEVERITPRAADRRVAVDLEVPTTAPLAAAEDDLRLVVANLLDNAVAYNRPDGRIGVSVTRADDTWQLVVSDTGIGIPRADRDRIFERFYRVDVERSRETGGTGLGLALVRHAVERHGGTVTLDSILGQGATFTVRLPIEPSP